MITALAGGVGAARFLAGLVRVVDPASVCAVVNVADDEEFHGLHVSPDLDSVTYTLGGVSNPETGWGRAGESFRTLGEFARFGPEPWFRLGDLDLATHLVRSERLRAGEPLSQITQRIARGFGVRSRILPVTDDRVRTVITVARDTHTEDLAMQEWFVRERAEPPVRAVRFDGAENARPAPGVIEAIEHADAVVVCPSNPVISIGPILALPAVAEALHRRREQVVAVSPLIAGAPVKGPADRLMAGLGMEVSCVGVARAYAPWCATLVIDERDAAHGPAIEALGVQPVVTDTLMRNETVAAQLAARTVQAARLGAA